MISIQENIPLAPLTTFRIGGSARHFVEISNAEEIKEALGFAKKNDLAVFVLGGGSNVLVSDKGFDGLVIKIKMNGLETHGNEIVSDAGVPLIRIINYSAEHGLSGIEMLAGIPGTVGGAIRGNAGAFGCEIYCINPRN